MYMTSTRLLPEVLDHLDALRLAARERVGLAIEGQVVEADVDHVLQPLGERGDDRRADRVVDRLDDRHQLADLHRRELGDVAAVDLAAERRLAEARALARRAGPLRQVGRDRLLRALATAS